MIVFLIVLILISGFALADLSRFPDNFIEANEFNGYIVVGESGTSTDVLSQSRIGLKVASYIGAPQMGINKMDNEIDIENNLILIGNPCVNSLTAELLGNPEKCDNDFPAGKASIRYIEKGDYIYIIVAGNNDKATKKAAEYLADFENNNLAGNEIEIDVEEVIPPPMPEQPVIIPISSEETEEQDKIAEDVEGTEENIEETETELYEALEKQDQQEPEGEIIIIQDENIFEKIWRWIISIFK